MADVNEVKKLEEIARRMRALVLETAHAAGAGHTGGSLSEVELLAALYFFIMTVDPAKPKWEDRDRLILSKGHASIGYYSALALRGYFPIEELKSFDQIGSSLQAHPDMRKCVGVDYSTGSLGQGLSIGIGMALGAQKKNLAFRTFVILGDGECQEGQVWEAAMFAGSKKVRRLVAIIDYNKVQLSNKVENNLSLEPFAEKWLAFGWRTLSADGNDPASVLDTLRMALELSVRGPVVVVANTVKGKGVSFMEGKFEWHGKAPNDQEFADAMRELGSV